MCSKKTDDICGDVCGQDGSRSAKVFSRVRCALRGLDFKTYIFFFTLVPLFVFGVYLHGQKLTYFLRPLWQSPPKPFQTLPHYYHHNASMQTLCSLHGWRHRDSPRRVFDAVLFSNEVDMLTIRWKELYPYVTQFVILESNSTFTGLPKPLVFAANREKFDFAEPRLSYGNVGGRFRRGENPFVEEAYQRIALDQLIRLAGIQEDDLLIMSDVDEIPSAHTIDLLRWCDGYPPVLHLQLRNYLYSFEYYVDGKSWRGSVHQYKPGKTRRISEFVFKMKAYSHTDRVRFSHYLNPKRIQDVICRGTDLFDMIPEEYTFREIIGKLGPIPRSYSAVHLPNHLIEEAESYKYLLPGNCKTFHIIVED
ncbi:hypothetical protein Rs2_06659 [Raphanus sativus]|nr:hypothetical protein Rs2_06659 [Raphanus sativus]